MIIITFSGRVSGDVGPIIGQWQSILLVSGLVSYMYEYDTIEIFCSLMQLVHRKLPAMETNDTEIQCRKEIWEHPSDRKTAPTGKEEKQKPISAH